MTDLTIQFYVVVDPGEGDGLVAERLGEVHVPLTSYERTVETDIFGTKPNGTNGTAGADRGSESDGGRGTNTQTATPTPTATDDGGLVEPATTANGDSTTESGTVTITDGGLLG